MTESGLKFKCLVGNPGKCLISHELSKSVVCKECKFMKCYAVGMDPSKILGAEEKRKFVRKRYRVESGQTTRESPDVIIKQMIRAFDNSKELFALEKDTEKYLAFAYLNETTWSAKHTESFIEAFQTQCIQLMHAIAELDFWQNICKADQDILQKNNLDLFKHYLIARYFMSTDGISQLSWLLGPRAEKFYGRENNPLF